FGDDIGEPQGIINDRAGLLSAEYRSKLEALIREVEAKTSASVPGNAIPLSFVKISSISHPAEMASAMSVGPSITKEPSSKRALRRPMRRRSR
ncbi:MAG: TPM domain-containing protein, partial [Actinobacteria bacterium]|nr:TPM domain-containing protein [Actinomycetota bacterium]